MSAGIGWQPSPLAECSVAAFPAEGGPTNLVSPHSESHYPEGVSKGTASFDLFICQHEPYYGCLHTAQISRRPGQKVQHCLPAALDLRPAQLRISRAIRCIERNRDFVHRARNLREYIAPMDDAGMAVGIEPNLCAAASEPGCSRSDEVEAECRLSKAAPYELLETFGPTLGLDHGLQRRQVRFCISPERCSAQLVCKKSHTKQAAVGASVGHVEIEPPRVAVCVHVFHGLYYAPNRCAMRRLMAPPEHVQLHPLFRKQGRGL